MVEQSALQPSPLTLFRSSQVSLSSRIPLPHFSHSWPATGQRQPPDSTLQLALQPSPADASPSSQVSGATTTPLPHCSHNWPAVVQLNPGSLVLQSELQPSPPCEFPSSHTSTPPRVFCRIPSPQAKQGWPGRAHTCPASWAAQL